MYVSWLYFICFYRSQTDFALCGGRQGGSAPLTPASLSGKRLDLNPLPLCLFVRISLSSPALHYNKEMAATAKYCDSHFYPIRISLFFTSFLPDIFPQQEKGKRRNADVRQTQQHQPFAGRKHACQNTENKCHSRKSRYVLPAFAALYRSNNICQYPKEQSNCPREYRKAPYSKKFNHLSAHIIPHYNVIL